MLKQVRHDATFDRLRVTYWERFTLLKNTLIKFTSKTFLRSGGEPGKLDFDRDVGVQAFGDGAGAGGAF